MELNYKEFGQGHPIIILHGLFGTLDNWQTIAKKLAEEYSVYILDQRNHGRSPHTDTMDYPSMAEDLKEFMEGFGMYGAYIIGHSMGGKTAMQFALEYPDMVDKLIVVDISPSEYPERHNHIFEALLALDLKNMDSRKEAEDSLAQSIEDEGERLFLLKNLSRRKEGGYEFKMNLPVLHKHYDQIIAPIHSDHVFDKPALFIRGGNSRHIMPENEPEIKRLFPEAIIKTIENAGHWVHADQPEELLGLVRGFLKV